MKKPVVKSLVCTECGTVYPNSFIVNSTIQNYDINLLTQDSFINGVCPVCKERTSYYISDNQVSAAVSVILKSGYNVFQATDGHIITNTKNGCTTIDFYGSPYIGIELPDATYPDYNSYNNILLVKVITNAINVGWYVSIYVNDKKDQGFEPKNIALEDFLYNPANFVLWRISFGLRQDYIKQVFAVEMINRAPEDVPSKEATKFMHDLINEIFTNESNKFAAMMESITYTRYKENRHYQENCPICGEFTKMEESNA